MDVLDGRAEIEGVASLLGLGLAAAERLCGERRVEVALEGEEPVGALAYDAKDGVVHITRLTGERKAQVRLLAAPLRFAESEGSPAEMVVPDGEDDTADALRAAGFSAVGSGPRFEGKPTTRYRYEPGDG
jgi:hypothetical protein